MLTFPASTCLVYLGVPENSETHAKHDRQGDDSPGFPESQVIWVIDVHFSSTTLGEGGLEDRKVWAVWVHGGPFVLQIG